ncbi:hypothetical protein F3I20_23250 [Candidatus Pantoea gossypiicola]|uniref:Uncharacterized protein n=1 Tax=Candidatus Pantoea gossypiicola TaxID=2608008 RepID=A0AB34CD59_9GAMM|nr:hypothetical protein [Pantoea gossypiicola]KAA6118125.1 hypothetical protein F3I20_23250 [Pantoea gossypiicola]
MRPNVRRVVTGRMSRKFTVTHPATSDWQPAGVSNNRGVIYPADTDALQFAPEGTRLHDAIVVLAAKRMAFGDVVAWHDERWRITHLQDFSDYGYYYAVAVRTAEPAGPDSGGFADA